MTVFLGDSGRILLKRLGAEEGFITLVNESDLRINVNRFSVDFAHEQIITGDRIEITTTGGEDLTWVDATDIDSSITRYAHVDEAGGIRLYNTFTESIRGLPAGAVPLKSLAVDDDDEPVAQEVLIQIVNGTDERCLAEITSYQITTNRETIDTTHLGAHYRKQYEAGLIQGQGQIECFWRQPGSSSCDDVTDEIYEAEFSSYLARLCIRLVHGAAFHGQFYIYADDSLRTRSVWYESESCIVTNVAITVSPTELVRTTIDFVTSGPIALREGYIPSFLELEESEFDIQLEQEPSGNIELENPD